MAQLITVTLSHGDSIRVVLADSDGEFIVSYAGRKVNCLTIESDLPDTTARVGVIYCEDFSQPAGKNEVAAQ